MLDTIEKAIASVVVIAVGFAVLPAYLAASSDLQWTLVETETGEPFIDTLTLVVALLVPGILTFFALLAAHVKAIWA